MASTFPGMNPYLEHARHWQMFHNHFVPVLFEHLNDVISDRYVVKLDLDVYLHEPAASERRSIGKPDTYVADQQPGVVEASTATISAPLLATLLPPIEEIESSYVQLLDKDSMNLVTVIELTSPTNKDRARGRGAYLSKMLGYRVGGVNIVELDLLRAGQRLAIEPEPISDYRILVARAGGSRAGVWPVSVRSPLPAIGIPLRAPDADLPLELQPLLDRVIRKGRYERYIYNTPLEDPISPEDRAWAEALAAAARSA